MMTVARTYARKVTDAIPSAGKPNVAAFCVGTHTRRNAAPGKTGVKRLSDSDEAVEPLP